MDGLVTDCSLYLITIVSGPSDYNEAGDQMPYNLDSYMWISIQESKHTCEKCTDGRHASASSGGSMEPLTTNSI